MNALPSKFSSVEQAPGRWPNAATAAEASDWPADERQVPAEQIEWEAMLCLFRVNPLSASEGR